MTVAFVLVGFPAMASSIEIIGQNHTGNGSVVVVTCAACPPAPAPVKADTAPMLAPGTQDISLRDSQGKKQLVRKEAWLGGSPVTYVTSNPAWLPADEPGRQIVKQPATIDTTMTTSAVAKADVPALPAPPAFEGTSLRPSL